MNNVAIILSTYNGERYLSDFLQSLSLQDFQKFDLYVRDDGSQDNTLEIVNNYKSKLNIKMINDGLGNLGPAKSFFVALNSVGNFYDYYMFADQDDWWLPSKVSRAIAALDQTDNSVAALYCSALYVVDEQLNIMRKSNKHIVPSKYNALVENIATGCTICINKAARDLILSNLPERFTMHDWWMYLVVSHFGKVIYDPQPSIMYRQHANNSVGGSIGFFHDYRKRFLRFFSKNKDGALLISAQSRDFLQFFENRLSKEDKDNIISLTDPKDKWKNIRNSLFSPFYRQSTIDNIILRLLFLLGRY